MSLIEKIEKLQRYDIGTRFSMSSFADDVCDVVRKEKGQYLSREEVLKILQEEDKNVRL